MSSNFHSDGTLFIVSGPSGAGKTTLINRVRDQLSPIGINLHFSVSHTTRSRREGEDEGRSYYFVGDHDFAQMVERREFLEWAKVTANCYATAKTKAYSR